MAAGEPTPYSKQNLMILTTDSGVTAITNLSNASAQVVGADNKRSEISFHNPNVVSNKNIAVCPAKDKAGNALAASFGGGSWVIFPGATLTFKGFVGCAWNAICDTAGTFGLTIMENSHSAE